MPAEERVPAFDMLRIRRVGRGLAQAWKPQCFSLEHFQFKC
jgi:hypothetical protein